MTRILVLLIVLVSLAAPAQAQWEEPYAMEEPLARRIVSTCAQEARLLGPYYAWISVFSVPEPDGSGHRLYVGFVDDIHDRRSPAHLWRGPVAVRWAKLGPVPEHKPLLSVPNPARYRVERTDALNRSGQRTSLMEIDLEAKPAQLRLLDTQSGRTRQLGSQPLEEVPMNDSLRLLVRLGEQKCFFGGKQSLRSYSLYQGYADPPRKRPPVVKPWQYSMDSHLLVVSLNKNPDKNHVFFLPMRPSGWTLEKALFIPGGDMERANFVVQMVAQYLVPNEHGELMSLGARHRVSVGFSGLFITPMEMGLVYDGGNESWEREKPKARPKSKAAGK